MAGNGSIQFLRGSAYAIDDWAGCNADPLLDGQPLYDLDRNILMIGGGGPKVQLKHTL